MFWLYFGLLLIPAIFYQNFMHELSHLVIAKISGDCWAIKIIPFWHWYNLDTEPDEIEYRIWRPWELWKCPYKYGRFYFAGIHFVSKVHMKYESLFFLIPLISAMCLGIFVYFPLFLWVHKLFLVLFVVACVDFFTWMYGYINGSKYCDGQRYLKAIIDYKVKHHD